MRKNRELALEICSLTEKGYLLADNQQELTVIQKLFYSYAYPVYDKAVQDAAEDSQRGGGKRADAIERDEWKERYRERRDKNRERLRKGRR